MSKSSSALRLVSLVGDAPEPRRMVLVNEADAVLVGRMRAGELRAEEVLFKRHAPAIHRMARRMLRHAHDADDIVQEAFAEAHERIASLRDATQFKPWLLRIAVSRVHRRFRRRRLLAALGFVAMPESGSLAELARPGLDAEQRLELVRIDQALGRVPIEERSAWLLRHVDGLALDEVAAACNCSLATAKRRIARVHAFVRAHAGYEGGADE